MQQNVGISKAIKKKQADMMHIHKIAITIVVTMLIYNYFYKIPQIEVLVKLPKFTLLGPKNTSKMVVHDVYDQLIDLKDFAFKVNPQPCNEYQEGLLLMVLVPSDPLNYENRIAIRRTWGQIEDSMQLVFLLGETDNVTIAQNLDNEITEFGDIVQGNFVDAYRNMTYKHVMGLKWVSHHCQTAKYILKIDDDVLVNIQAMRHFLTRQLSPWGAENLISCRVLINETVHRTNTSKWMVPPEEFAKSTYPTFCAGWAILYSNDVVPKLLKATQETPYFWIDDVLITGIVAEQIKVPRTSWENLILSPYKTHLLLGFGPNFAGSFLLGPPQLDVDTILDVWDAMID